MGFPEVEDPCSEADGRKCWVLPQRGQETEEGHFSHTRAKKNCKIEHMCYNVLICIYLQKCTLTTWICTQTARYASSKNTAILAIIANFREKNCEKPANVPSYKDKINLSHLNNRIFSAQTAIWRYQKTAEIAEKPHINPRKQKDAVTVSDYSKNCITDSDNIDSRCLCYNL